MAVRMNILGTKKVIDLCQKMEKLESFVHVSTAYSNCIRQFIDEKVYEPAVDPYSIMEFVEWMPDELDEKITPTLIGSWPNTYTFTKAIAESLVVRECQGRIPCAIVRPAVVGASWRDPFPGWVDNYAGLNAMVIAVGKGLKKTWYGHGKFNADIIPVDFTVNMIIVAG